MPRPCNVRYTEIIIYLYMVQKQIEKELKNVYSNMSTSKKDLNSNPQGENESFKSFVLAIEILQLNTEERDS